jgi:hypothetical protein
VDARRAPKRILHAHPADQRAQIRLDLRPPSLWARLPTPVAAKAGPVPTHERLGPDDCEHLQDRRKPAIQLDKEPAIIVREPDATRQPTPHDIQLMSKHRVLSFKPQLRLEWRGQDGQNETEQPDHSASLSDSITSSTRIRFSVHTPGAIAPFKEPNTDETNYLQTVISDLQRTASPYRCAKSGRDRIYACSPVASRRPEKRNSRCSGLRKSDPLLSHGPPGRMPRRAAKSRASSMRPIWA